MTLMTNRQTYQDDNQNPKKPETPDFSKFNVHDSFSVPTTDTTLAGSTPDNNGVPDTRRISKRQLEELDRILGDRDQCVLREIQKYRYLMTGQIQRLLFTEATTPSAALRATSRNLKKLKELGLVDNLSRRIGGVRAGSGSLIWYLTHAGERLLRLHNGQPQPMRRFFEPSSYFLAHTLAVAEIAIRLIEICRKHEPELTALQLEPKCWRSYSDANVALSLKPDLYAATMTEEYDDRYFLEVDLDTESPAKIIEKCEKYHKYYRSGLEQEEYEVFPLTIWIVPSAARKEKLIRHLREAFDKQPKLFAIITGDELEDLILQGGDREMLC